MGSLLPAALRKWKKSCGVAEANAEAEASDLGHGVGHMGVAAGEVQAADDGVAAGGEDLRAGELGACAVGGEGAGEADALGVVAAMSEGGAAGRREEGDQLLRGDAIPREPAGGVGEGSGGEEDESADEREREDRWGLGRVVRCHCGFSVGWTCCLVSRF